MNLTAVQQSAAKVALHRQILQREQEYLTQSIREVHKTGVSLRKIAEAAELSHESVRRIVQSAD